MGRFAACSTAGSDSEQLGRLMAECEAAVAALRQRRCLAPGPDLLALCLPPATPLLDGPPRTSVAAASAPPRLPPDTPSVSATPPPSEARRPPVRDPIAGPAPLQPAVLPPTSLHSAALTAAPAVTTLRERPQESSAARLPAGQPSAESAEVGRRSAHTTRVLLLDDPSSER